MSDPSPKIDPKQSTEATLCAYLENELPPAERAEIERHLAANPQHRQLLSDLAKTREWMRAIPTESAPVDMAELFYQQAERSLLLDDPKRPTSAFMARWPQYAMVAAIIMLMVGLSVLLFAMLRGPRTDGSKSFSMSGGFPSPATLPSGDRMFGSSLDKVSSPKGVDLAPTPSDVQPPTTPTTQVPSLGMASAPTMAEASKRIEAADENSLAKSTARTRGSDEVLINRVQAALLSSGHPLPMNEKSVCFVVTPDTAAVADQQLRDFFNRHQLAFDDANKSALSPATQNNNAIAQANAPASVLTNGPRDSQIAQSQLSQPMLQNSSNNSMPLQQQLLAPTTNPALSPVNTGEVMYVSRGLTPLQLELLAASLETDNPNQTVRRLTISEGATPLKAQSLPPIGAVAAGQTLRVTVAELVGPGIDKTNTVKVSDDGTIALPMIDSVPAAGLLPAEVEKKIAEKYRDANLIPQATVSVSIAAPTPQTPAAATQAIITTQPTTLPAASQPITATSQPTVPLVNVVVVIQRAAAK